MNRSSAIGRLAIPWVWPTCVLILLGMYCRSSIEQTFLTQDGF